jgi:hypothetical protein
VGDFGRDTTRQLTAQEVRDKRRAAGMYQVERKPIVKKK